MISAHITSFLKLITAQLEETSRGITSSHHFHNVQCGIENILSLLEYNNDLVHKADELSRRASNYITRHDMILSKISERDISEDADRLRATYEALAGFRLPFATALVDLAVLGKGEFGQADNSLLGDAASTRGASKKRPPGYPSGPYFEATLRLSQQGADHLLD